MELGNALLLSLPMFLSMYLGNLIVPVGSQSVSVYINTFIFRLSNIMGDDDDDDRQIFERIININFSKVFELLVHSV